MRKFVSNNLLQDIPLPTTFGSIFQPLVARLATKQVGSMSELFHDSGRTITTSLLASGPVVQDKVNWICDETLYTCCPSFSRQFLDVYFLPYLKTTYNLFLGDADESSVTCLFERYSSIKFIGEMYGSVISRENRSSWMTRWCKLGGEIDVTGSDLRQQICYMCSCISTLVPSTSIKACLGCPSGSVV